MRPLARAGGGFGAAGEGVRATSMLTSKLCSAVGQVRAGAVKTPTGLKPCLEGLQRIER
jgi:hypothetical protein